MKAVPNALHAQRLQLEHVPGQKILRANLKEGCCVGGAGMVVKCAGLVVDSPFFSTIVLFKNQLFSIGFCWLSGRIPGKNREVSPRLVLSECTLVHRPSTSRANGLFKAQGPIRAAVDYPTV